MAKLPTIEVSQGQMDVLLETFGTAAGYRKWLKRTILKEVKRRRNAANRRALRSGLSEELPSLSEE